jgi:hypothetical protein
MLASDLQVSTFHSAVWYFKAGYPPLCYPALSPFIDVETSRRWLKGLKGIKPG